MLSKLAFLIFTLTILSACTEKGTPIREHQPVQKTPVKDPAISPVAEPQGHPEKRDEFKILAKSAKDVLLEVILPLADRVLDPKRVTDPHSMNSHSVLDEMIQFNHLILQLPEKDRSRPEFLNLIKRYENALTLECGDFTNSCKGMLYLKLSANSGQVVKLIAQLDSDNRYRMLLFAFKMKNQNWDLELVRMLFANPTETLSQAEVQHRASLRSFMATALQIARDKSHTPEEDRNFLESIRAWQLAEGEAKNFGASNRAALYSMIARAGLIYTSDGSLHPDLRNLITEAEKRESGLFAQQKRLQEAKLLSADLINAQHITHFDELYFLIDRVYRGDMDPESASTLFASTKKDAKELCLAIENYLRLGFLLSLNDSSEMAIKIFGSGVQGQQLATKFISESVAIRTVWGAFSAKADLLRRFGVLAARTRADSKTVEERLIKMFNSTQKSINLGSAYPHTLLLFHLLSQNKFELAFGWRSYDTGFLINQVWTGEIPLLLNYSSNQVTFNQFQLVYAFDMAVRTSLFRLAKVDADFFISDTLRRLNGESLQKISNAIADTNSQFARTVEYDRFKEACGELSGKPARRTFYFADVSRSPVYGNLVQIAFTDIVSRAGGLMGIYFPHAELSVAAEHARLNVGNNLRLGRAMLSSYSQSLRKQGLSDEDVKEKTKLTRAWITQMEKSRKDILESSKKWWQDLGDCYFKVAARDFATQAQASKMEIVYLRQVYRDLKELRGSPSAARKAQIEARYRFKNLPSDFTGLDHLSLEGYKYTQIDFLIRMSKYVSDGLVTESVSLPPIDPNVHADYGAKLDIEHPLVNRSESFFIPFMDSEDDFVKTGMRIAFNGRETTTAYAKFADSASFGSSWENMIMNLATFYRMEREVLGHNEYFTAEKVIRAHEDALANVKASPDDVYIRNLLLNNGKVTLQSLNKILIKSNSSGDKIFDRYGLYDYPLKLVKEEQLGIYYQRVLINANPEEDKPQSLSDVERPSYMRAGKMYYESRARDIRGVAIIPYNPELDAQMDADVVGFVREDLRSIQDFLKFTKTYVKDVVENLPPEKRPRVDVGYKLTITEPMLSDYLVPSYEATVNNFNQKTGYCFASDTKCPAFQ